MVLYEPISKGGKTMKTNNKTLVESYKKTAKGFEVKTWVFDKGTNAYKPLSINMDNNSINENSLIKLKEESALSLETIKKENLIKNNLIKQSKNNESNEANSTPTAVVAKEEKSNNTLAKIAIVGLLAIGGYILVKDGPTWFNSKENVDENGNLTVDIVNVEEQKKYYEEVTEEVFKDSVANIVNEYSEQGFDADYKGVSATLFFANMQSIDPEVVTKLIEEGYLENDFIQNMSAFINFDAKVRHINNVYSTDKDAVRFISVAPFAISNQKDYENILYSEQLLHNIATTDNVDEKFSNLMEYRDHVSGPEIDDNYKHGYDDLTIGYRALNRRFLAPVFDFATTNFVDETYREYLNTYSMDVAEIVGFMSNFEECFENTPKTK
jgi:hypothetical protein